MDAVATADSRDSTPVTGCDSQGMRRAERDKMMTHGSPMIRLELITEQANKHNQGDQPKLQRCCDHAQSYEINESLRIM